MSRMRALVRDFGWSAATSLHRQRSLSGICVSSPLRDVAVPEDLRVEQLIGWLTRVLGTTDFAISVASADASFRRYFRISRPDASWVAMDAPPEKEDVGPY